MKGNICKNYFSEVTFFSVMLLFCFLFPRNVNAQLTYGGQQLMYWGPEVCNSSGTNVHFIIEGTSFVTLYASPATMVYGGSVEFGVSQVGTYSPVPVPCIVAGTPPIPIWVTEGTYIDASTSYSMKDRFFAGTVNPFIKTINT